MSTAKATLNTETEAFFDEAQHGILLSNAAHNLTTNAAFMEMFATLLKERYFSPAKNGWVSAKRKLLHEVLESAIEESKANAKQLHVEKKYW
jgi:hypothetical protein